VGSIPQLDYSHDQYLKRFGKTVQQGWSNTTRYIKTKTRERPGELEIQTQKVFS
jgi:hypothetical protein